jgi:hypothetical protein
MSHDSSAGLHSGPLGPSITLSILPARDDSLDVIDSNIPTSSQTLTLIVSDSHEESSTIVEDTSDYEDDDDESTGSLMADEDATPDDSHLTFSDLSANNTSAISQLANRSNLCSARNFWALPPQTILSSQLDKGLSRLISFNDLHITLPPATGSKEVALSPRDTSWEAPAVPQKPIRPIYGRSVCIRVHRIPLQCIHIFVLLETDPNFFGASCNSRG